MKDFVELPEDGVYRETIVSKEAVDKELEMAKIIELSRDKRTGIIGEGISEGEIRNGVKVKLGRRVLKFVEKVFNRSMFLDKKFSEITTKRIMENHARLKKMGFPVINTMRLIDTPDDVHERILMTDLTEGGKNVVLSTSSHLEDDPLMSELVNADEVSKQLLDIYKKLNNEGVQTCHHDVFFLVVNKESKQGRIVMGDISRIIFADDPDYLPDDLEIKANNYENMKDFVGLINRSITNSVIDFDLIKNFMIESART